MKLYPYQKKIFDAAIEHYKHQNNLMIVVPTGGGKTVILSHLIKHFNLRTLVVAHTKELIDQCRNTLSIQNIKNAEVRTIQSCYRDVDKWSDFDFLIVDECHRSCTISYLKLIEKFNKKKILGLTATPFRSDGQKLEYIFGKKISPLNLIDMIENGLLCDFEGYRVKTSQSLRGISTKKGDFVSSKLAAVVNVKNRNELIVGEYKNISPGEKALCFSVNIKHAIDLQKEFELNGISAKAVHGKLSRENRIEYIEQFKKDKIKVLINCQILTEGFDEPSVTCLLMARPTLSKVLYMQMIGRGSRNFPGKSTCKVIEFTDNSYNVCSLDDLLEKSSKTHTITRGERLSRFRKRINELLDDSGELVVEKYKVVEKPFGERAATPWQINFIKKFNVEFSEDLTELQANEIISKITG